MPEQKIKPGCVALTEQGYLIVVNYAIIDKNTRAMGWVGWGFNGQSVTSWNLQYVSENLNEYIKQTYEVNTTEEDDAQP